MNNMCHFCGADADKEVTMPVWIKDIEYELHLYTCNKCADEQLSTIIFGYGYEGTRPIGLTYFTKTLIDYVTDRAKQKKMMEEWVAIANIRCFGLDESFPVIKKASPVKS